MNAFDAIIFDFDGVILDSEPLHYQIIFEIVSKMNMVLSQAEFEDQYLGLADKDLFPKLFKNKGYEVSKEIIDSLIQEKIKKYIDILHKLPKLPIIHGVELYIQEAILNNKKIAICSGSSKKEITVTLNQFSWGDHFKTIVSAEDIKLGKPSPEGYLLAAHRLGVAENRCMVIEDASAGVIAAKSAGMYVVALRNVHQNLSHADKIVSGFEELLNLTSLV